MKWLSTESTETRPLVFDGIQGGGWYDTFLGAEGNIRGKKSDSTRGLGYLWQTSLLSWHHSNNQLSCMQTLMRLTKLRAVHAQVVQLHSTSASAQSPTVDYESGMEAMVLAILQQTNYSQQSELADLAGLALQLSQDGMVEQGMLLNAYSGFLADALASNAMVQGSLGDTSTPSLLPASGHMQILTLLTSVKTVSSVLVA